MEKDNRNAYSEVIEILKLIDDEKRLEALPIEMLEILKSKANPEYKPQISSEIPLDEQNLQPETLSILSWITMKYWSDEIEHETEKENIQQEKNKEIKNNKNEDEEKDNKTTNLTEDNKLENQEQVKNEEKKPDQSTIEQQNTNLPILHQDLKWYQKIKVKIIEFFHRIFRKDQNENKIENK